MFAESLAPEAENAEVPMSSVDSSHRSLGKAALIAAAVIAMVSALIVAIRWGGLRDQGPPDVRSSSEGISVEGDFKSGAAFET